MKNFKKIASAIAALSLAACVAVPMSATVFTASAANVTITDTSNGKHTYEMFQIFKGTLSTAERDSTAVLTGIEWGDAVKGEDNGAAFLADLTEDSELSATFGKCTTAKAVADALGAASDKDDSEIAIKFANFVGKWLEENDAPVTKESGASTGGTVTVNGVDDGYYLVQDKNAPAKEEDKDNSGAKTRFVLQVIGNTSKDITTKQTAPTVDKQVQDDEDGNEEKTAASDASESPNKTNINPGSTWYETADHALFEDFQFKLTAQLPSDNDEITKYQKYYLKFNDTLSKGVTFDSSKDVTLKIGEETWTIPASTTPDNGLSYATGTGDEGATTLTITIDDIVAFLKAKKPGEEVNLKGMKVEVTYHAYLNEKATLNSATGDTDNGNKVSLTYSNNPNFTGAGTPGTDDTGETPEDSVWVFSYQTYTNKLDEEESPLAGATFELRTDKDKQDTAIKMVWDASLNAYRPVKNAEEVGGSTSITTTGEEGNLNFAGLDAGTYYWVETSAPDGYNLAEPVEVKIAVDGHSETTPGGSTKNNVTFASDANLGSSSSPNTITNQKGASLPSTGGIGTTLFYLGGGALVAVAGVMLITKKRMTKE